MIDPGLLADGFERNTWILEAQAKGLSHADALLQTPYPVNCLNWVLGHLLEGRGLVLEMLGRPRVVPAAETARYARESDPVLEDGPDVLALGRLLDGLRRSGEEIAAAVRALGPEGLAAPVSPDDDETLGAKVHFRYFHDTYHTGQAELLRQVAGIGDKVI
ncbi:MAG: DinB family protein [Actinobacteria bacterium]|nr:DinB family protein [Actinomycetota bacterium]